MEKLDEILKALEQTIEYQKACKKEAQHLSDLRELNYFTGYIEALEYSKELLI